MSISISILFLFNIGLLILGIILFVFGYVTNYDYYILRNYPVLNNAGTILNSHIQNINSKYKIIIKYKYIIENKTYVNDDIYKKNILYDTFEDAEIELQKYRDIDKLGGGVNIIYNPLNPHDSYLNVGKQENIYYITSILIGIIPFLFAYNSNNC
jgi:hypothetical protein